MRRYQRLPRIAGEQLQRIRARHFALHPFCVMCWAKGVRTLATILDHRVALANGGKDVAENRQGLCGTCSQIKTNIDLGYKEHRPYGRIGADGFPVPRKG